MIVPQEHNDFFYTEATLPPDAPYVQREADAYLLKAVLRGDYCNVLTARQMGKSSLMVRMTMRLEAQGVRTATIDLSRIGTEANTGEWYAGLEAQLKQKLRLTLNEETWLRDREHLSPVQRFAHFLRQAILEQIEEPVVIFVDEIDSTLNLTFTDDFFIAIRAAYNARATDPSYKRLTFVLLGVAHPTDLIKDRNRTPYNIGTSIDLTDFTWPETTTLLPGLAAVTSNSPETVLDRIYYWSNGHPYLTQKICAEIAINSDNAWTNGAVDRLVEHLFLSNKLHQDSNLEYIDDRLSAGENRKNCSGCTKKSGRE